MERTDLISLMIMISVLSLILGFELKFLFNFKFSGLYGIWYWCLAYLFSTLALIVGILIKIFRYFEIKIYLRISSYTILLSQKILGVLTLLLTVWGSLIYKFVHEDKENILDLWNWFIITFVLQLIIWIILIIYYFIKMFLDSL